MYFLLEQSQRDHRRELLWQGVLDEKDCTSILSKIDVLEGLDYVTALCKIDERIIRSRPDTATIAAVYNNIRQRLNAAEDNEDGTDEGDN